MRSDLRLGAVVGAASIGLLVLGLASGGFAEGAPNDEEAAWDVTLRGVKGIARAVSILEGEARRRGVEEVLVALDTITFAAPPGRNEYRADHAFEGDLEAWLDALVRWASRGGPTLRITATAGRGPVKIGAPGWREHIRTELAWAWWEDEDFEGFEPAARWIKRWMPGRRDRSASGMLVLITSDLTPEQWINVDSTFPDLEPWRLRLLPVDRYWDEEAIGGTLARANCPLFVVAPEARFGDHLPLPSLPAVPWAARPQRPPALELPEARRDPGPPSHVSGGRFLSSTPRWFHSFRGTCPFNDDTPSAFGYWPFARAAYKSGGRYLFYPFPPGTWLDVCPRDDRQLRLLAPELGTVGDFAKRRLGDPAVTSLCRATALVLEETPWRDRYLHDRAGGWSAFAGLQGVRRTPGYRNRRKPYDSYYYATAVAFREEGRRLERLLPQYDRALEVLDRALRRVRSGQGAASHPRAIADLRLARYWFAMSAFHLQALSIYMKEIDRFLPEGWDEKSGHLVVTYVPTIKMSDCLDAYDGRTLSAEQEKRYLRVQVRSVGLEVVEGGAAPWAVGHIVPGQQGNILQIDWTDPNYRAKRPLSSVLRYLDRRLMARALDMIGSARVVMKHHAKTPWGWTVYYSEAATFVFEPLRDDWYRQPRSGEGEEPRDTPATPRHGGSTPGGPTTGG